MNFKCSLNKLHNIFFASIVLTILGVPYVYWFFIIYSVFATLGAIGLTLSCLNFPNFIAEAEEGLYRKGDCIPSFVLVFLFSSIDFPIIAIMHGFVGLSKILAYDYFKKQNEQRRLS